MGEVPVIDRIRSGGFLPLQLTIDPLQKILLDMMEMIKDHDSRIINVENNKCEKGDLDKVQNTVDRNKEETDKRLDELEKLLNDKTSDLQKQIDELREKTDDALNKANEALEKANDIPDFSAGGSDNLQNDLEELSKRLTNLENTVKENNDRLTANDEKLQQSDERLNDEVEELKKRIAALESANNESNSKSNDNNESNVSEAAFNDLSDRVNDLDRRVKELEDRLGNIDEKQLERRLRDIEDRLSDLESNSNSNASNGGASSQAESDGSHANCAKHSDINKVNRRIDDLENELRNAIKDLKDQLGRRSENGRPRKFEPVEKAAAGENNGEEGFAVRPPTERTLPTTNESSDSLQRDVDDLRRELEELKKLVEQLKATSDDHEQRIADLEKKFADTNLDDIQEKLKKLQADIDSRPDKNLIERLFEKFRESLNNVVDMINQKEGGDGKSQIATTDDIKRLEKMIKSITQEFDEAAAARKCTKCLSCGMGYRQVAGALPDAEQASILGAAPISQVVDGTRKPCFVYGSDHELYYSDSPRGRSFVASARSSYPAKPAK